MNDIRRRRQLNKEYRKTSDAGFSLIELLIAVTILAIIVVPLLHMFVTSTRINVKSRQTLRATTVAQDIMEGLKAYSLEEISAQFAPPEGVSGDVFHYPSDGFYILNSSLIQGGVRDLTEVKAEHEGVFYFGIENLKMQGGEYDALIRLDASTYGEDKDTYANPHDNVFNTKGYAQIGSVAEVNGGGGETDSSYHESKKLAEAVMKYAKQNIGDQITDAGGTLPADWDDLWDDMEIADIVTKRVISIEIDDAGTKDAEGNEQCKATINFTYDCSYSYSGTTYTCTTSGDAGSEGGEVVNITRTFSSGNFYLFYYPIYSVSKKIDSIELNIKNVDKLLDEEKPLLKGIVVAKQIRSDVDISNNVIAPELPLTGPGSLQEKEYAYGLKELVVTPNDALMKNLNFRTNLYTNLADGTDVFEAYNSCMNSYINPVALVGDTTSDKVTNVIYDIEITVYQTGAAQHFTENNFEDNDDVHRLATITNMSQ